MKPGKTPPNPAKKRRSAKTPENPAAMRVQSLLLQNDTDVCPDSGQIGRAQIQSQQGFKPVFHHDPSLPISVNIAFNSG